jgi:NADH-quinone oxidoreductase subunit J
MSAATADLSAIAAAALFAGFAVTTLGGAVTAVLSRRVVRAVSGLALCFLGLSGIYYFLNSPFLALMQILIYVGAICVTIMFAVMLTDSHELAAGGRRPLRDAACLAVAGALGAGLILLLDPAGWLAGAEAAPDDTLPELGRALLYRYGFAFELISALLLLAILGALAVARSGRRLKP